MDGHISDEKHLTCNKIWNESNMKNMGDYHDHYLKKDVLLLADVFEKFIDTCLAFCKLDLAIISLPWIKLGCDVKSEWCRLEKISELTYIYSLKKN